MDILHLSSSRHEKSNFQTSWGTAGVPTTHNGAAHRKRSLWSRILVSSDPVYGVYVSGCKIRSLTILQALAGFVATALFTFGAIILGYLTKSLPEDYLTDLDHKVVEDLAHSRVGVTFAKAWKAFTRILRRCLFLRPYNEKDDLDRTNEGKRSRTLYSRSVISSLSPVLQSSWPASRTGAECPSTSSTWSFLSLGSLQLHTSQRSMFFGITSSTTKWSEIGA